MQRAVRLLSAVLLLLLPLHCATALASPSANATVAATDSSAAASEVSPQMGEGSPITSSCDYTSDSGVQFDNLNKLRNFYSDYYWQGTSFDYGDNTVWGVAVNVCRESSLNAACRAQSGSVCITNMTSSELTVAGKMNAVPAPRFDLIEDTDASKGVKLTFSNAPFGGVIHSTLLLRCDQRLLTPNVSGVIWSPLRRELTMLLDSVDACPTYVPPPPSHFPKWAIVFIAIACAIVLYITCGCLFLHCVRGLPLGWASCPQKDFWCAAPRVIARTVSRAFSYVINGCKPEPDVYAEL